jgi:iron complex outermembrane receptor protein
LFNGTYLDDYLGDQCALGGGVVGPPPDNFGSTNAYTANSCSNKNQAGQLVGAGLEGANRYHYIKQDTDSYAAFGQLTWNIRDDLRTTAGLRYTYEEKTAHQGAWAAEYEAGNTEETFDPLLILVTQTLGEFVTHNYDDLDRDDEVVTWSLNVQWDATEDTMLYSSVATGFKSGGFNSFYLESAGKVADPDDAEFDKEESPFSAEIGAKMILADGAADLNIAVFYSKFDDLQAAIFAGSTSFLVQNAARADTRGVEIDGRWQITERLLLQGSAAYLDFTYDHFPNQACTYEQFEGFREDAWQTDVTAAGFTNQDCANAGINDVAGQTSENNPKWQANIIAQHIQPMGNFELMSLLALTYQDAQYRQGDLDPILKDEQYVKVDFSLLFGPATGRWELAVIGRNLTDQTTYSYGNDAPFFEGARQVYIDEPRNYAVRATVRY